MLVLSCDSKTLLPTLGMLVIVDHTYMWDDLGYKVYLFVVITSYTAPNMVDTIQQIG